MLIFGTTNYYTMKKLIQLRNEEFVRRCADIFKADLAAGAIRPLDTVIERALNSRPRCHYLDFDTASRRLHCIERHGLEAAVANPLARAMWAELASQVSQVRERRGCGSFCRALTFVLTFMRPSRFYISPDTARRLLTPHVSYSITSHLTARL